ncbi:MAG: hypothetical protein EPO55_04945 [Reyranella sp.]|uniref:hypothetical protein n=1 Tax=Reyranella sp. TaxID=1929291 RepID=UPI0012273860|nr:hypothetical protein [Reyranella sp.]TAJ41607.1 MAG: hypothetical protein EPO55_04945 [Reyranella sp.]
MPVHWTIEPDRDLVTVVAEGEVTCSELVAMVDALHERDAHGYRKLYDGGRSIMRMTQDEVLLLGVYMRAEHARSPMGPMAAILPEVDSEILARLLGMVALADRPFRLFAKRERALKWLLALPPARHPSERVGQ